MTPERRSFLKAIIGATLVSSGLKALPVATPLECHSAAATLELARAGQHFLTFRACLLPWRAGDIINIRMNGIDGPVEPVQVVSMVLQEDMRTYKITLRSSLPFTWVNEAGGFYLNP